MARSFSSSEPLSETVAIERLVMQFAPYQAVLIPQALRPAR
jgi:hypothetical protein